MIPTQPKTIFRRAKTLKNALAPSDFRRQNHSSTSEIETRPKGNSKCNIAQCKCCNNIQDGISMFKSNVTGETYPIKTSLNGSSTYVIYILECECNFQHVGRTTHPLRVCINKHQSNVQGGYTLHSISRHALQVHNCSFEKFSILTIEQTKADTRNRAGILAKSEMFWLYKLQNLVPYGLNEAIENVF